MTTCLLTTTQTIGPFPHEGWRWAFSPEAAVGASAAAAPVRIEGRVLDGDGQPVSDAMLEAVFTVAGSDEAATTSPLPGLHRVPTDDEGRFALNLPRPAPGQPAAWITVFARGLLQHQFTAVLLADDPALATSTLLPQVPAERRDTLLAQAGPAGYRWDLRLQGDGETVFFDYA